MTKRKKSRGMKEFKKTFESVQGSIHTREIRQKELELNPQGLEKTLKQRQDALDSCKVTGDEIWLPIDNRLFILVDKPKVSKEKLKDIRLNPRYSDVEIVVLKKTKKNVKSVFNPIILSIKENIKKIKKELKQVE